MLKQQRSQILQSCQFYRGLFISANHFELTLIFFFNFMVTLWSQHGQVILSCKGPIVGKPTLMATDKSASPSSRVLIGHFKRKPPESC